MVQIKTSDFASLYPNLIINYECIRFPEVLKQYASIKSERIVAKKNKDKSKDSFLKLVLNATSGLLDNKHSWLYYPEGALRLRLLGQIILTKCIEECLINGWKVISANTDGIEVIIPKEDLEKYEKQLNNVAKEFNLDLEHEDYNKIIYKNVNNYICITENNKIKKKGLFVYNPVLGNSTDEQVIAKCLELYYIKGIKPEEVINNPDKYDIHIYDFCKSNKISKDFTVYHNGIKQQNLNRYYFSKNAPYLFKKKKGSSTMQHVNVGLGVELFNEYKQKEYKQYNINTQYYISSVYKLIEEINRRNQLTLF